VTRRTCAQCGLVNFAVNDVCRRCGAALDDPEPIDREPAVESAGPPGLRRRLLWVAGVTIALIFLWSRSLLLTSDAIDDAQSQSVRQSIRLLEHAGFAKEVVALRHFANYRATDNWWNLYVGHHDAYAATNFPLGVVTLYPAFFTVPVDDTERAAILLHESQHLLGSGEETALEYVWRQKPRIGWTAERYSETRVWKNTREWTASAFPAMFRCGQDERSDCPP
jgi:hypothetical protein